MMGKIHNLLRSHASGENWQVEERAVSQRVTNVPYYSGPDAHQQKHLLDIYIPKLDVAQPAQRRLLPVAVFVHGGGWRRGDKKYAFDIYGNMARLLTSSSYVVFVPNYRLSPEVRHPAHTKDVALSLKWIRENAARYGGDPDGHSAGAHIVSLIAFDPVYLAEHGILPQHASTATQNDNREHLTDDGGGDGSSPSSIGRGVTTSGAEGGKVTLSGSSHWIRGVVAVCAPLDILSLKNNFLTRRRYITQAFGEDDDVARDASPLYHASLRDVSELPPMLLINAGLDPLLVDQAAALAEILQAKGHNCVVRKTYEGTNHYTIIAGGIRELGRPHAPMISDITFFINSIMKGKFQEAFASGFAVSSLGELFPSCAEKPTPSPSRTTSAVERLRLSVSAFGSAAASDRAGRCRLPEPASPAPIQRRSTSETRGERLMEECEGRDMFSDVTDDVLWHSHDAEEEEDDEAEEGNAVVRSLSCNDIHELGV